MNNPTNCIIGTQETALVTIVDDDGDVVDPKAAFLSDPSPAVGLVPLTVQFTDTSTGSPTSWQWDFDGDGQVDATEQHPQHTFMSDGPHTVTLTAANQAGEDTATMTVHVAHVDPPGPEGSDSIGCFLNVAIK